MKSKSGSRSFYASWSWLVAILCILAFALALRLINYTGVLDWDVLEYTQVALDILGGRFAFSWAPTSSGFRIALILPLVALYSLFGPSELVTVAYPLVVSLFSVLAMHGIGRLVADERAGLLSALIWAALPLNVFLSTLFGPDGLLANFTIISVYFVLLADSSEKGRRKWLAALASVFFAIVAVFVKPSAVTIFGFLAVFVAYKALKKRGFRLAPWVSDKRFMAAFAGVVFIGLIVYGFIQRRPFILGAYRTSLDLANFFILGSTQETLPGQLVLFTLLFFALVPFFLVGFSRLLLHWDAKLTPVLLWAAALFLYFEWAGRALDPRVYAPFYASLNDRNLLFVFAPFIVLVAAFLARWLTVEQARLSTLVALAFVTPLAWFQRQALFTGSPNSLVALGVTLFMIAVFALPFLLRSKRPSTPLAISFVVLLLVAFLYPTPPLHLANPYWQQQIRHRAAISQAADFLLQHPQYPVATLDARNGRELNWSSRFQLGFTLNPEQDPGARIHVIENPLTLLDSAYLYLRDETNQFQPPPARWWRVAEIESGGSKPIVIYRILSSADAQQELAASLAAFDQQASVANAERLLAAGVNAGNSAALLRAWSVLHALPEQYPIQLLTPVTLEAYQAADLLTGGNLFVDLPMLSYNIPSEIEDQVSVTSSGDTTTVTKPAGRLEIAALVPLDPASVYIFVAEVRSSAGVDLLCETQGVLSDSHPYHAVYGDWQQIAVVFGTGDWQGDARPLELCLFEFQSPGQLEFRSLELHEVHSAE